MSLNAKNLNMNLKNTILIIIIIVTMVSSVIIIYNFFKESNIDKERANIPAPRYTIAYSNAYGIDKAMFEFQTNC
jgi:flagellar basal body-associated protein FliL